MLRRVTSLIVSEIMEEVFSCWRALVSSVRDASILPWLKVKARKVPARMITVNRIRFMILVSIPPITSFLYFFTPFAPYVQSVSH